MAQRFAALERANVVRLYRAELKRDIAAGRKRLTRVLADPDERIATMRVWDLLLAQPKVGRVRVGRIHNRLHISPSKTVGGLSERQRRELAEYLR